MLSGIFLHNFKSLRNPDGLRLTQLSLLCGSNSSGKSSVIQALLLLKQSLESPTPQDPLILNGAWIALGEYGDIRSFDAPVHEPMEFGVTVDVPSPLAMEKISRGLRNTGGSIIPTRSWARRNYRPWLEDTSLEYSITVSLSFQRVLERRTHVLDHSRVHISSETGWVKDFILQLRRNPKLLDKISLKYEIPRELSIPTELGETLYDVSVSGAALSPTETPIACTLRNFLPWVGLVEEQSRLDQFVQEFIAQTLSQLLGESSNKLSWDQLRRITRIRKRHYSSAQRDTFMDRLQRTLVDLPKSMQERVLQELSEEAIYELETKFTALKAKPRLSREPLEFRVAQETEGERLSFDDSIADFRDFFTQGLFYLGPLRDEPRAFYRRLGSNDPTYVGQRGENTAFVLQYYGNHLVCCIEPPESEDPSWCPSKADVVIHPLKNAVAKWLRYFGLASDLEVRELGKLGLTMRVNVYGGKEFTDLTNVGVGVSQVLPILVLGLVAPLGSTLLLEQPELHLHPFVQSRLADFFLSLAPLQKQVVAETHSEHLIHRVRYYVAKGSLNPRKDIALYFFSRPTPEDGSVINPVHIGSYGEIDEWPEGFFDQTTKMLDAIMEAAFERSEREEGR